MTHATTPPNNSSRERGEEEEPLIPTTSKPKPNPLPKLQIAIIYTIKLTFPIAYTQTLPFYNALLGKVAASEGAETGHYSGLAHSAYSVARLSGMFLWGRLSDSIGRVPVIVLGTFGTAVFSLLFGLSDTLTGVLINRFLAGLFSGITGAIHSVVGELSDKTNESTSFPLYDVLSAMGYAIGPLIGGTFASPAKQWPTVFSSPMWQTYPYLLPCIISAFISVGGALLGAFVLEETLPIKRKRRQAISEEEPLIAASSSNDAIIEVREEDIKPHSVKDLLSIPVLRAVIASSSALGFGASCFTSVFSLMAYAPLGQGGLELSPSQIGRALSGMGTVSILLKLCMPLFLRRFGTLNMFDFCMIMWPLTYAVMPFASWVARMSPELVSPIDGLHVLQGMGGDGGDGEQAPRDATPVEWATISLVLFLSRLGALAYSIIMILTRDHAPGSASLGTANGLAELAQEISSTLGTAIASSLFAVSASKHLLGGHLWVVFMVLMTGVGSWVAHRVRRYRRE